jgi:hypothetical protein
MRGSIIAASNMVGYIFLLLGATFLKLSMDLFYFTATQNFIFLFVVTFGMWSIFAFAFRYSLLRPILLITLGLFFRVKVSQSYRGVYRASNLNWIHRIAFMSVFEPLIFVKKCEKLPSWWCRVWGQLFSIIYILDEQNKIFQTIKATTLQIDGLIVLENDTRKEVPQLAIERRKGVFDFVISLQG